MNRGLTITKETGQKIASDLRTRRFEYEPQRAVKRDAGGGDGSRLARFLMTSNWSGTTATATIYDMDGNVIETGATLEDPEAIFAILGTGNRGLCIIQDGRYFIIQANCPTS